MDRQNHTVITEVFLLGFYNLQIFKFPFVCLIILSYCLIVMGNILIIVLVSANKSLHLPMYFFLQHLSLSDILLTTDIVPNLLHIEMNEVSSMSLIGCITQFSFFASSELTECFLLTVMSYDRYLAICSPLRYSSIMEQTFCTKLVAMCWLLGFSIIIISVINISSLHFCKENIIDHFFCDLAPLLGLSCSDPFLVQLQVFILGSPATVSPFLIVIASYVRIAFTVLKIKSNAGRQKAFSTCSSHLTVVSIFYGTLIGIYILPKTGQSMTESKFLSLLYTVVTPLLNPIIYSIRSKDIKGALGKCMEHALVFT